MTATLEKLISVRSQLAEGILAYLRQLADALDRTDWMRGEEPIKMSDIAVEPFALTKERRRASPRRGDERGEREAMVEKRSPMDEIEAQRYELPVQVEAREEVRWRQVVQRGRVRLGVKGAPGSGKTFITRHTLALLARQQAERLERQEMGVDEVEILIWVMAKALAQALRRLDHEVAELALQIFRIVLSIRCEQPRFLLEYRPIPIILL